MGKNGYTSKKKAKIAAVAAVACVNALFMSSVFAASPTIDDVNVGLYGNPASINYSSGASSNRLTNSTNITISGSSSANNIFYLYHLLVAFQNK